MRIHQWVKNLLLFVPLVMSHQIARWDGGGSQLLIKVSLAALAFSFCASAVYVLNDLLDIESDRAHPVKRLRPFASGALSTRAGWIIIPSTLMVGLGLALAVHSERFLLILLGYLVITTAYSIRLKRMAVLDILVLAGLFTLRLFAGAVAAQIPPSPWLLAFSTFLFLTLAFAKRFAELSVLSASGAAPSARRPYAVADQPWLGTLGAVSGYLAVLVFALYINNSPDVKSLYSRPDALWFMCPILLYAVTRLWSRAYRGQIPDDPIATVIRDPASYVVAALMACVIWIAALPAGSTG